MKDKKAAKKLLKLAKEHPDWYTKEDILYAKSVKRRIKLEKKLREMNEDWNTRIIRQFVYCQMESP